MQQANHANPAEAKENIQIMEKPPLHYKPAEKKEETIFALVSKKPEDTFMNKPAEVMQK